MLKIDRVHVGRGASVGIDPTQQALCYYALGVALDRSGDLPSAWQALDMGQGLLQRGERFRMGIAAGRLLGEA